MRRLHRTTRLSHALRKGEVQAADAKPGAQRAAGSAAGLVEPGADVATGAPQTPKEHTMTTARVLRAFVAGLWIGLRASILYLLVWPVWSAVTMVVWMASIITGAWFALMVLACPGEKLKEKLIGHTQFWFGK
jgi:hypothetical protein